MSPADEIRATSYAVAVEQALYFAENAFRPKDVIDVIGFAWGPRPATWDDAVYVLAYAWRRRPGAGSENPILASFRRAA